VGKLKTMPRIDYAIMAQRPGGRHSRLVQEVRTLRTSGRVTHRKRRERVAPVSQHGGWLSQTEGAAVRRIARSPYPERQLA
jgi:hypothetical protein